MKSDGHRKNILSAGFTQAMNKQQLLDTAVYKPIKRQGKPPVFFNCYFIDSPIINTLDERVH